MKKLDVNDENKIIRPCFTRVRISSIFPTSSYKIKTKLYVEAKQKSVHFINDYNVLLTKCMYTFSCDKKL